MMYNNILPYFKWTFPQSPNYNFFYFSAMRATCSVNGTSFRRNMWCSLCVNYGSPHNAVFSKHCSMKTWESEMWPFHSWLRLRAPTTLLAGGRRAPVIRWLESSVGLLMNELMNESEEWSSRSQREGYHHISSTIAVASMTLKEQYAPE
jgi:hypothetical protein